MVPMRAHSSSVASPAEPCSLRELASATFFGLLLIGLLVGCGSGGSSSGGTTGPTAQATAVPAIQSIPPTVAVVGKALTYDVDAIDADSTALIYSLTVAPAGMSIVPATGVITWTPQATQVGDQTVSITVSDGLNSRTQTFVLSVFGITQELASVQILSATGGTVTVNTPTSSLNGLTLTFPPLALPGDTTIRVSELATSSALAGGQPGVLRGISLEPEGLVLNSPVTVTIPFDPAALNADGGIVLPDFLGVFFLDPSTGQKVYQDTFRVDTVQNVLVGTLDHFSEYFSFKIGKLCPPPIIGNDCPSTYSNPAIPSRHLPALLVHGFIGLGNGMGNELTWGELRTLLGEPPVRIPLIPDPQDRIDVWRFDYNSRDESFRKTAHLLAAAIARLQRATNRPAVNVVAHSFGGILTRTYLQGMASADGTGNPAGPFLSYLGNVNKLMTLGTPHRGIGTVFNGDNFSRFAANFCAIESTETYWPTCFEAATALRNTLQGIWQGKGAFLFALNQESLPTLVSSERPQYHVIIGDRFTNGVRGDELAGEDGLITTAGADICVALGGHQEDHQEELGNGTNGTYCSNNTNISVRTIANSPSENFALCHTDIGCGQDLNWPMVEVSRENMNRHPSWPIIRAFLTTGSPADTASLPVVSSTLTVSTPSHGTIASDPVDIQCGTTCVASFDNGTSVTLSAFPASGYTFSGWSGACVNRVGPCRLVINANTTVQATFAPQLSLVQGTWSPAGSLTTGRYWHAATLLPNGRVRVVGGYGNSGILTSAEEYDPAANGGNGSWAPPTDGLQTARLYHTATFLSNGKVLVVGGYTNTSTGNASASAELFDPAANGGIGAWRATGNLTTARLWHTATLLPNGKVLVVGGSTSTNSGSPLASAELYDPAANGGVGAWTPTLHPLATARVFHTATLLLNGKVLVAGGQFSGGCAELYDPAANGGNGDWSTTGCLTTARAGHTATRLLNGKVLVAGGTSSALATTETFDPAANGGVGAWGATGSLTTHRYRHTATLLPTGKVLVVGGSPGGVSDSLASAELYDPAANGGVGPWTPTLHPLTTGRQDHTATLLPNGTVLVVGGSTVGGAGFLASAELFQ